MKYLYVTHKSDDICSAVIFNTNAPMPKLQNVKYVVPHNSNDPFMIIAQYLQTNSYIFYQSKTHYRDSMIISSWAYTVTGKPFPLEGIFVALGPLQNDLFIKTLFMNKSLQDRIEALEAIDKPGKSEKINDTVMLLNIQATELHNKLDALSKSFTRLEIDQVEFVESLNMSINNVKVSVSDLRQELESFKHDISGKAFVKENYFDDTEDNAIVEATVDVEADVEVEQTVEPTVELTVQEKKWLWF